jgi:hypothetical protein
MEVVNFKYGLDDRVKTNWDDVGKIIMLGCDYVGPMYYVVPLDNKHTLAVIGWYPEKNLAEAPCNEDAKEEEDARCRLEQMLDRQLEKKVKLVNIKKE